MNLPDARLHIVTGKGGTGKTTVTAALAITFAMSGRRVLIAEIEGRNGLGRAIGGSPLSYSERRLAAVAPLAISGIAIDPESALLDYLQTFYQLGMAGRALRRIGAVDFAATVAPGVRDVLVVGKLTEIVRRKGADGEFQYDAVIVDAPPIGRVENVLGAAGQVGRVARAGPIRRHADLVTSLLSSEETAVHIVTLLEELPVTETLAAVAALRAAGMDVASIVENRVPEIPTGLSKVTNALVAEGLRAAELPSGPDAVSAVASTARGAAGRLRDIKGYQRRLDDVDVPRWRLRPHGGDVDFAVLREFAGVLAGPSAVAT